VTDATTGPRDAGAGGKRRRSGRVSDQRRSRSGRRGVARPQPRGCLFGTRTT